MYIYTQHLSATLQYTYVLCNRFPIVWFYYMFIVLHGLLNSYPLHPRYPTNIYPLTYMKKQPNFVFFSSLEECGPTALGPALLVATTMASKVRGSKVILCTDGLANVGMGKLDNFKSDEEVEEAGKFYEEISAAAVDSG